jgi:sigma-B regulation protein RsbU (phosphoserine phosphatase)
VVVDARGSTRNFRVPGRPIGLGEDAYEEYSLTLAPGDRMYLYTDGLTDVMNRNMQRIGEERCLQLLGQMRSRTLSDSVSELLNAVEAWAAPDQPHDDISLIAIEML